ncbi:5' nucleotidase family [Aphelenchoides besseyi]|nr:5' nucleotidase family [Aphelenchoides besseyi]
MNGSQRPRFVATHAAEISLSRQIDGHPRTTRLPTNGIAALRRAEFAAARHRFVSPKHDTTIQEHRLQRTTPIHAVSPSNCNQNGIQETTFPAESSFVHQNSLDKRMGLTSVTGKTNGSASTAKPPQKSKAVESAVKTAVASASTSTANASTATSDQDITKPMGSMSGSQPRDGFKKSPGQRIFVGRSLRLEKIRFFGFDMDYTLASYKSPNLESMAFDLMIERLVKNFGYPEEFKKFSYNASFPVRGLWFDYLYGNLLKVDGFGNILVAVHGFRFLKPHEIEELYPNKFLHLSDSRVYVLNTLFNLPETYLIACLVDYFDTSAEYHPTADKTGVKNGEIIMSYKSLFQDLRNAIDWLHFDSDMKKTILSNLDNYVEKDERAAQMLQELRAAGRKTFLLTNSDYTYTNGLMTYILGANWTSFFDITVVDARKPLWFAEGTVFREVNTKTGALQVGIHTGPLRSERVYSGGSCTAFCRLVKCRGKDVLYVGDHIFGDVLRSKKARGWRTMLIVPELNHELTIWTERHKLFEEIANLDIGLAQLYKNMDATSKNSVQKEIAESVKAIRNVTHEMDQSYGILGSLFRSGSRTTFFATQVERYADIYSSSPYNLIYYPTFYFFRPPTIQSLPHESTVDHLAKMGPNHQQSKKAEIVPIPRQPAKNTSSFCHEDIDEEEPPSEEEKVVRRTNSGASSECEQTEFPMKCNPK